MTVAPFGALTFSMSLYIHLYRIPALCRICIALQNAQQMVGYPNCQNWKHFSRPGWPVSYSFCLRFRSRPLFWTTLSRILPRESSQQICIKADGLPGCFNGLGSTASFCLFQHLGIMPSPKPACINFAKISDLFFSAALITLLGTALFQFRGDPENLLFDHFH